MKTFSVEKEKRKVFYTERGTFNHKALEIHVERWITVISYDNNCVIKEITASKE